MIQARPIAAVVYRFRLPLAVSFFVLLFICLYPHYQYILDDDGVGYASVARRWAAGDWYRAINGLWSPLHSWVAIPFYAAGLDILTAFKYSNACIGAATLVALHLLLQSYPFPKYLRVAVLWVSIPFLLYSCFFQLAADVLFTFLFLLYLWLCSHQQAFEDLRLVVVASFVGAFCYYAKAYGFPLFLLHFSTWQFYLYKKSGTANAGLLLRRNLWVGVLLFLVLCLPWIFALHHKYGVWTISLNVSYGLIPRQAIDQLVLVAPPWPDAATPWEDPFIHSAFDRPYVPLATFLATLPKEMVHNLLQLIQSLNRLTYFGAAIALIIIWETIKRKTSFFALLSISLIALPSGYVLLHVEERFLWPLFFLLLMGGSLLLHHYLHFEKMSRPLRCIIWLAFFAGFVLPPLDYLEDMRGKDKPAALLAQAIKEKGIKGSFASNADYSLMRQVAFQAGLQYYETNKQDLYHPALPEAIKKHGLKYFLFYTDQRQLKQLEAAPIWLHLPIKQHYPELKLVVLHH